MRDTTYHERLGHKGPLAYCTDCRTLPDGTVEPPRWFEVNERLALYAHPVNHGVEAHAFSQAAEPVLRRALELVTERGGTHGDTWALPMRTPFLDAVLDLEPYDLPAWKRLLMCAAFIDMKDIRAGAGEFNPDDLDDGVNYRAAFRSWRSGFDGDEAAAIHADHAETRTGG